MSVSAKHIAVPAVAAAIIVLTGTHAAHAGCSSDVDCKGDRVCVAQVCVAPTRPEQARVVAPTPPPTVVSPQVLSGGVRVTSDKPGTVLIDGRNVGLRTPCTVDGLTPGPHQLRVDFDDGGDRKLDVLVLSGKTIDMHVAPSRARIVGDLRRGARLGVSAGGSLLGGNVADQGTLTAATLGAVLNVGIVPAVDFRTGIRLSFGSTDDFIVYRNGDSSQQLYAYDGFAFGAEVPAEVRFNLGSVYSMMVGGSLGFGVHPLVPQTPGCTSEFLVDCEEVPEFTQLPFVFGPSASVASFRLGENRQFELSANNWLRVFVERGFSFGGSVDVVWLFL